MAGDSKAMLEAMLRCVEEWCVFWERRARDLERGGEVYEVALSKGWG
jgi:hypothetical protein